MDQQGLQKLQHVLDYLQIEFNWQGVANYMSRNLGLYQWYRHGYYKLLNHKIRMEND